MSRWTEEQTERAVRLWREGQSATSIARILAGGFTRSAVVGKMQRMGLARAPECSRIGIRLAARREAIGAPRACWLSDEELPAPTVTDTPHARPWQTRRFNECAFPVDGEGPQMRACCAPGRARSAGAAAYCDAHHAAMFTGAPEPRSRRARPLPEDLDVSVLPEWDAA